MKNILNAPENNKEINFVDSFADELIDKKIEMGINFHELNALFNNELELDNNTKEGDIEVRFYYRNDFLPYFEKGYGEVRFYIHEEYGLWLYWIIIYAKEEDYKEKTKYFTKFEEYLTILSQKYGEASSSNYYDIYYWIKNENKLPSGVSIVNTHLSTEGDSLRIYTAYYSKSYFKQHHDWFRDDIQGILEKRAGIPDCCARAAMRGI
ncbi:MAG: hypothetical protein LBV17_03740 [Treponema sp.]|jgi:hypothetical protein|nr:hypothetical protein [Treponema sp.]